MTDDKPYTKREMDTFFKEIGERFDRQEKNSNERFDRQDIALEKIDSQVAYTNGQVKFHAKLLLVVGAVTGTLLITNGSELIQVFKLFI